MRRTQNMILALNLGVILFALIYGAAPPAPRYYPLEREWSMEVRQGSPSMGWYGRCALSAGAGLAAYLMTLAFASRRTGDLPAWLRRGATAGALFSLILLGAYLMHHELSRWGS